MCVGGPEHLRLLLRETAERTRGVEAPDFAPARGAIARAFDWVKDRLAGAPAASEAGR